MGSIELRLLGPVQVERDGAPVQGFESQKALALLCYLALHPHPLPRSHLATLFWGEKSQARSRSNLRRVLNNLTSLLPDCLDLDRHTARFRPTPDHHLDVTLFEAFVERGDPASLAAAVALYRGPLLAGLDLPDCPEFETWLVVERERWHQRVTQVLDQLIIHHTQQGEYAQALEFASRLLSLDPWREEAHRRKMLLLARTGQHSAALAQYETCRRILAEELGVEPAAETTALYERIQAARSARYHNLPSQPTPFVGREEELREIHRLLANPECRLLTLVGPGGIGKTRLALQVAAENAPHFLHGVCFVPVTAVPAPGFLLTAIAEALHLSFHGKEEPRRQLLNHLQDKELLLVLDGFEHLLEGAGLLTEMLEHAPDVKLLVTSRERLYLRWEWVFAVDGLPYPEKLDSRYWILGIGDRCSNLQYPISNTQSLARRWPAVQLFLQVASRVNPRFSLEDELPHVISICQLVKGMPLAIELAAAWARRLPCETIAQEIARNLDFLHASLQDVPSRHRSVRAAFDHSWRLLTEREQEVFRRFAVFRGGFHQEAAKHVARASPALLAALEEKSLLHRDPSGRYDLHELLRQYAEEKLREVPDEERKVRERHCAYYTAFLCQREAALEDATRSEVLDEISTEIENIHTGWWWAVEQGQIEALDKALNSLFLFYELRSRFQEGEATFECATAGLQRALWERNERAKRVLTRLLIRQGSFARSLGRPAKGRALLEEGLALARELGDQREIALALNNLGILAAMRGDYAEEKRLFRESLALYRALGDQRRTAMLLNHLAIAERLTGDYAEAKRLSQESLTLCRTIGQRRGMARALQHLAIVAHIQGAHAEAQHFYRESLALFREMGDQWGVALTLGNLGDLAYRRGDYAEARQMLEESLALRREMNDRWGMALALNTLGGVARATGNLQEAKRCFQEALEISLAIQSHAMVIEILVEWARLLAEEGETERAIEVLTFAVHHPATEGWTREIAKKLLTELRLRLPSGAAAKVLERGEGRKKVEEVAEQLLTHVKVQSTRYSPPT